jgi:hypothetical protein
VFFHVTNEIVTSLTTSPQTRIWASPQSALTSFAGADAGEGASSIFFGCVCVCAGCDRSRICTHFRGNQPSRPSRVRPLYHSVSTYQTQRQETYATRCTELQLKQVYLTSMRGSTSTPVLGSSFPMIATTSFSLRAAEKNRGQNRLLK